MRIGVLLPTFEIPPDPIAIWDFAQAAEHLGYTHLVEWDHIAGADRTHRPDWEGVNTLQDIHEPFVLFGYLAGLTRRLELVTSVLALSQRQTVLVAKQAAEVDVLSRGRLRLGVGIGSVEPEFRALNEDYHTRGARITEQVEVLRALWTQDVVTFHGRWHHIEEMGIRPLPVQRPIPIWLGGHAEAVLRRVAAIADGWLPATPSTDEITRASIERIHAYAREVGRDSKSIGIEGAMFIAGKTPDVWRHELEEWRALGASHVTIITLDECYFSGQVPLVGVAPLKDHIDAMRRFKEAVDFTE